MLATYLLRQLDFVELFEEQMSFILLLLQVSDRTISTTFHSGRLPARLNPCRLSLRFEFLIELRFHLLPAADQERSVVFERIESVLPCFQIINVLKILPPL